MLDLGERPPCCAIVKLELLCVSTVLPLGPLSGQKAPPFQDDSKHSLHLNSTSPRIDSCRHCWKTSVIYIATSKESAHFCQSHLYQHREPSTVEPHAPHVDMFMTRISYHHHHPLKIMQHLWNKLFMQNRLDVLRNYTATYMHTTPIVMMLFTLLLVFTLYPVFWHFHPPCLSFHRRLQHISAGCWPLPPCTGASS